MHKPTAIFSSRCWVEGTLQPATIHFENGIITDIVAGNAPATDVENYGNKVIMPGVIDPHVHVNEPGRTDWEGFDTATQAAAAGGITTIVDMPLNASPVTTNKQALQIKIDAAADQLHVNCGFYGGLIPNSHKDLNAIIEAGVFGIKVFLTHSGIDEFPNVDEADLDEAMPILAKHNIPLLAHCELSNSYSFSDLKDHPTSYQVYLSSRPKVWENNAIDLMIALCQKHQCKTHIVHVSSAEALAAIDRAKNEGLPITAETCTHYIYFNAEEVPDATTMFKCAPPIRELSNNTRLKNALKDGTLDFIASDHSPAPPALKQLETGDLLKAWGGIAGLQFLLPASWSALKAELSLESFIPLVTSNAVSFLQIDRNKGSLQVGKDADITVWSPEETFIVKAQDILHKHKISPYVNNRLHGRIHATFVNGIQVYNGENIINKNAGKCLLRK